MKVTALKIEFEAYGSIRIAYTYTWNFDNVAPIINALVETAHIRGFSTDLIDQDLFEEQNIERIHEWNTQTLLKIAA